MRNFLMNPFLNHNSAAQGQLHKRLQSLSLLALLFLLPLAGRGQDYSGIYYIASDNTASGGDDTTPYSSATDAQKYYLVPADNPQQKPNNNADFEDYRDAWYSPDHDATDGDPEKPFLTTYQTNRDAAAVPSGVTYRAHNSVWIVKKTSDNYYHVIHAATGKYVIYEVPLPNASNNHRKTMHLQTPDDGVYSLSTNENYKFTITLSSGIYRLQPKNRSGWYWNPANGNKDKYYGQTPSIFQAGLVGVYNSSSDGGSKWHFESTLLPAPTIVYDADNGKFIISYDIIPAEFTILYTTDGSDPTIGGATTQTYTNESVITLATIGSNPLKAVVEKYGFILTETASVKTPSDPSIAPTPGDCRNTVTITAEEGTSVFYTIDGTEPTNSSIYYTEPFVLGTNATIKAIAYNGGLHSGITTLNYSPNYSAEPTITQNGATITISGTGSIYYTTDGNDPNTGSTLYTGPITLTGSSGDVITIKAVAKDGDKELSCVAEKTITMGYFIVDIDDLEGITSHLGDLCILTGDINASSLSSSISDFTGTFEGDYYTISGLKKPLFTTLDGATVKNLKLDDVDISGSGNVGAICNQATGATKIYNCGILSGSVTGSGNVGGLVGLINSGSSVRVVNCYNYANVSGGNYAAGIVGKNEGTVSSDGTVGNVRIALCMMYGNVTDATHISPVYGGNHVNNVQKFTEYNYWRYRAELPYTDLNDQLPVAEDMYLTRFPYFRHILNTHRELAAFFLFGAVSCNDLNGITQDNIAEIGHWALKKDIADYPIIEPWPVNTHTTPTSTHNNLPSTTEDYAGKLLTNMGTSGYLSVSVIIGNDNYSVSLPITDMDTLNHDFTWGKVVLPFANEFEENTDYSKICTGWKITGITGGTAGIFANYNVSDRNCTAKDLFSTTGFIFAQGGNYIVPYGVTAITIEANFATAFYLRDESYEIGYSGDDSQSGYKERTGLGGTTPSNYHERPVYNTLHAALTAMSASNTTHTQAVVLVGNYHMDNIDQSSLTAKGYTIMSIDADNNQEPDYAIYSNNTFDRPAIPPTRFDFVAFIPMGMSSRVTGALFYPNTPIWKPRGWFEITETGLMRADQFELESGNFNEGGTNNCRCIINGGYFTQMVRSNAKACTKISYYQIGGNAYVKEFYPGNHSKKNHANTLVPINVTGGEIEQCFMTGYGLGTAYGTDIYFWCAGGRIHKFLAAYMEKPRQTTSSDGNVNMTAKIDHARIYRFFGGGTTENARITGNINVTIDNSLVDFYCGGPEFGDMESGKTVTTTANNTTFREYYGAGFGGTAITYSNDVDDTQKLSDGYTYPLKFFKDNYENSASDKGRLCYKSGYGIGNCYKFEFIMHSRGHQSVARFYTGYAMFSLAKTGNITNTLTNCTIEGSFYGGGCQGTVDGTVTSTLTDCTILHSAFGGGFKAESNEMEVYTTTYPNPRSFYNGQTGIFSDFGPIPTPDIYTWKQGTSEHNNEANETDKELYTGTDVTLTDLGNVTGKVTITVDGTTVVKGSVFGGGNESKVLNDTEVVIKDNTTIYGNVYGGGNEGKVNGHTTVIVNGKNVEP